MTRAKVIEWMERARQVHLKWARYQEKCRRRGAKQVAHVGSSAHHRKWAKIYDEVLRFLKEKK